uniref:Uncharacterized protein n=1 Tax=Solanum lycopersicum TaxID=4081 RepID=A0A3Q7HR30_SOLLC
MFSTEALSPPWRRFLKSWFLAVRQRKCTGMLWEAMIRAR